MNMYQLTMTLSEREWQDIKEFLESAGRRDKGVGKRAKMALDLLERLDKAKTKLSPGWDANGSPTD